MKKNNIKALVCIAALVSAMSANAVFADDLTISQGKNITHGVSDPTSYDNVNNAGTFSNEAQLDISNTLTNNGILNNINTITSNTIINEIGSEFNNKNNLGTSNNSVNNLTNNGFFNNGETGSTGNIYANNVTNNGDFTNNNSNISIDSSFTNEGTFTNETGNIQAKNANDGKFENNNSFVNNGGNITIGEIINKGTLNNNNGGGNITGTLSFTNNGEIINNGGFLNTSGTFENTGNIINKSSNTNTSSIIAKEIVNSGSGVIDNLANITANTNFTNSATYTNESGANLNAPNIDNSGKFTNKGTVTSDDFTNSGNGNVTNSGTITASNSFTNNATFTNKTAGTLDSPTIENSGKFTNNGTVKSTYFTNSGNVTNAGTITASNSFTNSATFTNQAGGKLETQKITNSGKFTNNTILQATQLENTGTFTNTSNVTFDAITNQLNGVINNSGTIQVTDLNNAAKIVNNKTFIVNGSNNTTQNSGSILNKDTFDFGIGSGNKLLNTGSFVNDGGLLTNVIVNNTNTLIAQNSATMNLESLTNTGKVDLINGSKLILNNQVGDLGGTFNIIGNSQSGDTNQLTIVNGDNNFVGDLNLGNGQDKSDLLINNVKITEDAVININQGGKLLISNNSELNLNDGDNVSGDISVYKDSTTGKEGTINLNNFTLMTGSKSSQEGSNMPYYSQVGGTLNLLNGSKLGLGDSAAMNGGTLNIDGTSQFLVTSEANGTMDNFLDNLIIADGGKFGTMNSDVADYAIGNIQVNGTTDFTIDVYARTNTNHMFATDLFSGDALTGDGVINVADWSLGGDIFGWDAPIDRDFNLGNIFDYQNIDPTVKLTATKKETFTPIGWYQLNNHGGIDGNYTLNLTRFNPQVYRGQVTTLSQYMNQLAIDDMLFNHSMLLPSFKDDDLSDNGAMANRYAAANPLYAPYQYSKKDGGLWYRMYGTFETLQMNQAGLGRVGNNAYGTIIGADFGLKELKNGWKFMPTAYIGYNGAHQYFAGMGAYQNGGQAGFLGTWYKNNFILGGLVYGGVYQNSMDIAGHTDNTFNYFAGASAKGAYNWKFHRDWVLQPNLMLAYNFFGQQNWHTDFGQMGMMSGTLNGINLAPGLNLIWEKETFSIYATLQYMYNLNGAVDGRAGNVSLPHLYMDRGYIQYGFGFTKRFADRFSGYFQTVFRNVGRTGVGFQLGLNIKIGK